MQGEQQATRAKVEPVGRVPMHRNLPLLLLRARDRVLSRFRPLLNDHGITEQQWRVVRELHERGPLEPRQIGAACVMSSPSITGVLARMDDLHLVERRRLDHDQRRVRVTLTAKSRRLVARLAPQVEAVYRSIETEFGIGVVDGLYRSLDDLLTKTEAADS